MAKQLPKSQQGKVMCRNVYGDGARGGSLKLCVEGKKYGFTANLLSNRGKADPNAGYASRRQVRSVPLSTGDAIEIKEAFANARSYLKNRVSSTPEETKKAQKQLRLVNRKGTIVQDNGRSGRNARGIVVGTGTDDDIHVCKTVGDIRGLKSIVRDAIKMGDKKGAQRLIESGVIIVTKNDSDVKRVGKVRKIPELCHLALKLERKGKL